MGYPNKIIFISPSGRQEEARASASITPGMLCQLQSDGTIVPHATIGGAPEKMVAQERAWGGTSNASGTGQTGYLDPYVTGDIVSQWFAQEGDVVWLLASANALAIVPGNSLTSNGDGTVRLIGAVGLVFSNTAVSAAVGASSTAAATLATQYTVPANTFLPGDQLRIKAQLDVATFGAGTLTTQLLLGATVLSAPAAFTPAAAHDQVEWDILLDITAIGASGSFTATGFFAAGTPGTATAKGVEVLPTAIDTTASKLISMTAQFGTSNASNTVVCNILSVEVVRTVRPATIATALDTLNNSANASPAYIRARFL